MSIVQMHKVTLCGPAGEKRRLVARLQELGCLHVVPLGPPETAAGPPDDQPSPADARRALRFLLDAPYVRRTAHPGDPRSFEQVVREVLQLKAHRRELKDRRDELRQRLAAVDPWGDFELPEDPAALGGYRLWFYALPHRQADALDTLPYPWQLIRRSHQTHYIVVLAKERPPKGTLPVEPVDPGSEGSATLRRRLRETEAAIEEAALQRIALTRYLPLLHRRMARAADAEQLRDALAAAYDGDGLFALQAWAPASACAEVRRAAEEAGMAVRVDPPADDELPPTELDNPKALAPGEDLAYFYQVPPSTDWDPSGVVLVSFALFFAMILSDAGYGLVVLGLAALPLGAWRGGAGARLRRLAASLGAATVGFGVLAGSYFGFAPPGPLAAADLIDLADYDSAMTLSVAIGVGHIALANAAIAHAHWPSRPSIARIGWIVVALAGFAAWRAFAAGWTLGLEAALGGVAAGLLLVLAFRHASPPRGWKEHLKRIADGALGVANVTKVFGDVLSYLRLFALGLATAMLAATFNDLAGQLQGSLGALGVLAALLTALIGHTLTFALAVVSGVVHGLRLEYIEFNAWALSAEGYRYRPLRKTEEIP